MSFFGKLSKKIIHCPICSKRMRIPVRMKRAIEVTCPHCKGLFRLEFRNSFAKLFEFREGMSFFQKCSQFIKNFRSLEAKAKFFLLSVVVFFIWIICAIILFLRS